MKKILFYSVETITDDLGNVKKGLVNKGKMKIKYFLPVSDQEVIKLFGSRNNITMKTITQEAIDYNDIVLYSGKAYRVKEKLVYENRYKIIYFEIANDIKVGDIDVKS